MDKSAGGLTHQYSINENTYIRSSLSATYSKDHTMVEQQTDDDLIVKVGDIQNSKWDIVFNSFLNKRFSSRHTNRTGITITGLSYDLDYKVSPYFGLDKPMEQISKGSGESTVFSAYSNSVINLSNQLTTSLGMNAQYFTLNDNWSVEPRAALKWRPNPNHSFAVAYGLHSRREKLDYYFVEKEINGKTASNRYLDFSKAHHFGFTYDWNINQNLHLKIEPYYQYLYHIPVEDNSSFSIINHEEFYLDKSFLLNLLAGKEWMVGRLKQNVLSVNGRLFFQGGERYTPVDEEKSMEEHDIVFDESKAYSKRFNPAINGDVSVSFRINKKKVSHEFSLKILNVGMRTGIHFYQYNERTNIIEEKEGTGLIPNISYKIYF